MIINLLFSLCDGLCFVFPFWYIGEKRVTVNRIVLLLSYAFINMVISYLPYYGEIIRELLLFMLSYLLIVAFQKRFTMFDLVLFLFIYTISDICILSIYLVIGSTGGMSLSCIAISASVQIIRFISYFFITKYLYRMISNYSLMRIQEALLILVPIMFLFETMYQQFIIKYDSFMVFELICSVIALFGALILVKRFYIVESELDKQKIVSKTLELSKEQLESNRNSQLEIRKIRHDMTEELRIIAMYIQDGNNTEALNYIQKTVGVIDSTRQKQYCSVEMVNLLINYKVASYPEIVFSVDCKCDADPGVDPIDLAIIISNLIDNGVTEITSNHLKQNEIQLSLHQYNGMIMITEINQLSKEKSLKTEKTDSVNHGLGLSIIHDIVAKYHGTISISQTDHFKIELILNRASV